MGKAAGPLLAVLLALPAPGAAEPVERESEYEMPAAEAWRQPGFRVQLRFGLDDLVGTDAPDASGFSFAVEPGIRLSESFTISAALRYAVLDVGLQGVRYTTTADLTWHVWDGLFLAGGFGYAGLVADATFRGCDGQGIAALARTGWLLATGEIFATGPVVQLDQQWTWCRSSGGWDPGERLWRHRTLHFSWSLAWR